MNEKKLEDMQDKLSIAVHLVNAYQVGLDSFDDDDYDERISKCKNTIGLCESPDYYLFFTFFIQHKCPKDWEQWQTKSTASIARDIQENLAKYTRREGEYLYLKAFDPYPRC